MLTAGWPHRWNKTQTSHSGGLGNRYTSTSLLVRCLFVGNQIHLVWHKDWCWQRIQDIHWKDLEVKSSSMDTFAGQNGCKRMLFTQWLCRWWCTGCCCSSPPSFFLRKVNCPCHAVNLFTYSRLHWPVGQPVPQTSIKDTIGRFSSVWALAHNCKQQWSSW